MPTVIILPRSVMSPSCIKSILIQLSQIINPEAGKVALRNVDEVRETVNVTGLLNFTGYDVKLKINDIFAPSF